MPSLLAPSASADLQRRAFSSGAYVPARGRHRYRNHKWTVMATTGVGTNHARQDGALPVYRLPWRQSARDAPLLKQPGMNPWKVIL